MSQAKVRAGEPYMSKMGGHGTCLLLIEGVKARMWWLVLALERVF